MSPERPRDPHTPHEGETPATPPQHAEVPVPPTAEAPIEQPTLTAEEVAQIVAARARLEAAARATPEGVPPPEAATAPNPEVPAAAPAEAVATPGEAGPVHPEALPAHPEAVGNAEHPPHPPGNEAQVAVAEHPSKAHAHTGGHGHKKKPWKDLTPKERYARVSKNAVTGGLATAAVGAALYEPYYLVSLLGLGPTVSAPLASALATGGFFAITGGVAATIAGSYFFLWLGVSLLKDVVSAAIASGSKFMGGSGNHAPAKKAESHAKKDAHAGGGGH